MFLLCWKILETYKHTVGAYKHTWLIKNYNFITWGRKFSICVWPVHYVSKKFFFDINIYTYTYVSIKSFLTYNPQIHIYIH